MDIKLSKAKLAKIIQSGGFLTKIIGNAIGKSGKESLAKFAAALVKIFLPQLAIKAISSLIANFEKKISG